MLPARHVFTLTGLLLLALCQHAFAAEEHSKRFGDYEVHYTVLNSTFIKPDIAQHYGITRGHDRALVNVAINKLVPGGETTAQSAEVSGSSSDLIHETPLEFHEVREGDAIYYLAELTFRNRELRSFTINFKPAADVGPYAVKFNQTLYFDE